MAEGNQMRKASRCPSHSPRGVSVSRQEYKCVWLAEIRAARAAEESSAKSQTPWSKIARLSEKFSRCGRNAKTSFLSSCRNGIRAVPSSGTACRIRWCSNCRSHFWCGDENGLERRVLKKDDPAIDFVTDAYATVAVAYHRAAGVYTMDKEMQELGTAAVHLLTMASSYIRARKDWGSWNDRRSVQTS